MKKRAPRCYYYYYGHTKTTGVKQIYRVRGTMVECWRLFPDEEWTGGCCRSREQVIRDLPAKTRSFKVAVTWYNLAPLYGKPFTI